jgi:Rrf2 family protein
MFSSTAEYALRAVVYLAMNPDDLSNSQTIAQQTKTPAGYISKILKDLAEAGIITSRRGPNGGFGLARPGTQISVLDVLNAVDPIQRIRTCPLNIPSHGTTLCRLHRKLDDTIAILEKTLREASIAEMTEPAKAGGRLIYPTVDAPRRSPASKAAGPRR